MQLPNLVMWCQWQSSHSLNKLSAGSEIKNMRYMVRLHTLSFIPFLTRNALEVEYYTVVSYLGDQYSQACFHLGDAMAV